MPTFRLRVMADLVYEADKPLSDPNVTMIANRTGTYLRVGAIDGLEKKIEASLDEEYKHQRAHHHDARYERCRPDVEASNDGLGPVE